jgi:Leucine-rich repeat (LRR) protein
MEDFDDALRAPGAGGSVNLSHRAYVTLDDQLWSWGSKVLVLNLSYNHIKLLDEGLGNLTHLHTLDVSSNALQALPSEIGGCARLRTVRLNGNQLTKLPEEITRCKLIEELVLSENRLTKLPTGIRGMLCLKRLMLANNNLSKLDCSIAQCTVLDEIDVTNNPIANVPEELRGDSAMILWIMRFEFGSFWRRCCKVQRPDTLMLLRLLIGLFFSIYEIHSESLRLL